VREDFDPRKVNNFRFVSADYLAGQARLTYALDDLQLTETIDFPGAPEVPAGREQAVQRALDMLHWLAGTSYYKASVPAQIEFAARLPDADAALLVEQVYEQGLAEFAYVNDIDLSDRIKLPVATDVGPAHQLDLPRRALVAIGGGKDSLVSIDLLLRRDEPFAVTWVGNSELIRRCAERCGRPTLNLRRQIAPELIELNRRGAYNGHVPVTAINSAILVLAALLYGYDEVVFSNESSAGVPTLMDGDKPVNHQWSKGPAFEQAFNAWLHDHVAQDLRYYSLLRPLSELAVTARFAGLESFFDAFSSCNRNFRLSGEKPSSRWCGECPKCHFVFLALAPFLAKPALVRIFGRNLLDESRLIGDFEALLEWGADKPFECVGEARESRAALATLAQRAAWTEDAVVAHFRKRILPQLPAEDLDLDALLVLGDRSGLPERLQNAFD